MKKRLLFLSLLMYIFVDAQAFDFSVMSPSGHPLYFNVIEGGVEVTFPGKSKWEGYYESTRPSGSLIIPDEVRNEGQTYAVKSVGAYAFYWCPDLNEVTIPNSVEKIGGWAFSGCTGLRRVKIGNGVEVMEDCAFAFCKSLTEVDYQGTPASWSQIRFGTNDANPICYSRRLYIKGEPLTEAFISNKADRVGAYAFFNDTLLTSVTISSSVTDIDDAAFHGCTSLSYVFVPQSVTHIGSDAFNGCDHLRGLKVPASVTAIGSNAFFPVRCLQYEGNAKGAPWGALCINGVEDGDLIFQDASKKTLMGCSPSAVEVNIPRTVTAINSYAFANCDRLERVIIPNTVQTIGDNVFEDCNRLESVIIPNSVRELGSCAFLNCTSLSYVELPIGLTSIKFGTFSNCSDLHSITIPPAVHTIARLAFKNCSGITRLVLPKSVKSIGDAALSGCSGLEWISLGGEEPPELGKNSFKGVNPEIIIYVPRHSESKYQEDEGWKIFKNIKN